MEGTKCFMDGTFFLVKFNIVFLFPPQILFLPPPFPLSLTKESVFESEPYVYTQILYYLDISSFW